MTADYTVTLIDKTRRICELAINGASIDEAIAQGKPEWEAREDVEGNAFANAIAAGRIGADAYLY